MTESKPVHQSEGRTFGLDVLRAAAILLVMFVHAGRYISDYIPIRYYNFLLVDGVSVFFVLSGFLIGRILLHTVFETEFRLKDLTEFWLKRWIRTLPNYFLVLTLLILLCTGAGKAIEGSVVFYYTFSQNLNYPSTPFFPEAWSLSVEEWFYLLIPLLFFILLRIFSKARKQVILLVVFSVIVFVTLLRAWKVHYLAPAVNEEAWWDMNIRKVVSTRIDAIMYGVLAAYFSYFFAAAWKKNKGLWFITGIIILYLPRVIAHLNGQQVPFFSHIRLEMESIGVMLLLPLLSNLKHASGKAAAAIRQISLLSYSMYLLNSTLVQHTLIPLLIPYFWKLPHSGKGLVDVLCFITFFALTIGLSYILYRFWEKPILKQRDKLIGRIFRRV